MTEQDSAILFMRRALDLAKRGQGYVEPNPMVGCVVVSQGEIVGEGWHQRFGGSHAEVEAIRAASGRAKDATLYVTLEPCGHFGKTPPCTNAILSAGVRRVVMAHLDPFPQVAGQGLNQLQQAGVETVVGLLEREAQELNAPYLKLIRSNRPWVIAKWAMSLDGKLATNQGDSCWISSDLSRQIVHEIRGRVDAIVVGRGTVESDDPLLTARPPGPRVATRIVLASRADLPTTSRLARTASLAPVLVVAAHNAPRQQIDRLRAAGCDSWLSSGASHPEQLVSLFNELGRRRMSNVVVEGGSHVLGALFDAGLVDEIHTFVAPIVLGGEGAASPVAGRGVAGISEALRLTECAVTQIDRDAYIHGRIAHRL